MEEIHFEIGHFRNFEGLVTLNLILDDLWSHIVRFALRASIHITIEHMAPLNLVVDVRIDGRTSSQPMLLDHILQSNDDLKISKWISNSGDGKGAPEVFEVSTWRLQFCRYNYVIFAGITTSFLQVYLRHFLQFCHSMITHPLPK